MKVIDLLNKIANGEDVPIKIKYKNVILSYRTDIKDYAGDNYFLSDLIGNENIGLILNDTVEILEEKKIPEKLSTWFSVELTQSDEENVDYANTNFENMYEKINEICDYLDYLKSKGDE